MVLSNPITLIILAVLGLLIAGYISYSNSKKDRELACPVGDPKSCKEITTSKYSKTFGVKNDTMGILYYLLVIAEIILLTKGFNIKLYAVIIASGALLFSIYLTYVQAAILKKWCFWCVISAIINLFIFIGLWMF